MGINFARVINNVICHKIMPFPPSTPQPPEKQDGNFMCKLLTGYCGNFTKLNAFRFRIVSLLGKNALYVAIVRYMKAPNHGLSRGELKSTCQCRLK